MVIPNFQIHPTILLYTFYISTLGITGIQLAIEDKLTGGTKA
jgi:hypothetical protein